MSIRRFSFLCASWALLIFFAGANRVDAAQIQRVGIQVAHEGCGALPGASRFAESPGEWSEWAETKENSVPYDCMRIFLAGTPTPARATSESMHRTDMRVCIQLAGENLSGQGAAVCTPWASETQGSKAPGGATQGGGWSGWAQNQDRRDPESVRVIFEERALAQFPDTIIQDIRIGLHASDNGCADIGKPAFTPWVSASAGWSAWAYDANAFRPDCVRVALESLLASGPLEASCTASLSRARVGERISWTIRSRGGSGKYSYFWSGTDQLASQSPSNTGRSHAVERTYRTKGIKSAQAQVFSGDERVGVLCPSVVIAEAPSESAPALTRAGAQPKPASSESSAPQAARQPLVVACSGSPAVVRVREPVAWRAYVSGGIGIYSSRWTDETSGARIGGGDSQQTPQSVSWVYGNGGMKTAEVVVSSGSETVRCSASITVLEPLRGILSGNVSVHRVEKNGTLLSPADAPEVILRASDRTGAPASERRNPSQFSQAREGEYVIEFMKRTGTLSAADAGQCWYAIGDSPCVVSDFEIASCGENTCQYPIKVVGGYVTKIAFRYEEPPVSVFNNPPSVKNLVACGGGVETQSPSPSDVCPAPAFGENPPGACTLALRPLLSWTYADADEGEALQSHYQIRIFEDAQGELVFDTGKVRSSSRQYIAPAAILLYGKEYRWDLRVWDSQDTASASRFIGPLFTTQPRAAPAPAFSWEPFRPKHKEETVFTDRSRAFGKADIVERRWNFQGGSPTASGLLSPAASFAEPGLKTASLIVRDSGGLSCGTEQDVSVEVPSLPEFKEVFTPPGRRQKNHGQ
ncbi:MAG: hypothetical protein HY472_01730 [Candidatus Sungbacteria bacterium]|nr:hypothetical protein [Candidatus Sungbacteria bacterium]